MAERRGVLRRIEAFPEPSEDIAHEADKNSTLTDETNDFAQAKSGSRLKALPPSSHGANSTPNSGNACRQTDADAPRRR